MELQVNYAEISSTCWVEGKSSTRITSAVGHDQGGSHDNGDEQR